MGSLLCGDFKEELGEKFSGLCPAWTSSECALLDPSECLLEGEVTLRVPKLRDLPFETAIIERYRRSESSVEEALVERD